MGIYSQNRMLKNIFNARNELFQIEYIKKYGMPNETKESDKIKEKLDNLLKNRIKDNSFLEEINKQIENFVDAELAECNFWIEQYYKLGFTDAIQLSKEVNEPFRIKIDQDDGNFKEDLFDECIEDERYNVWNENKKYKEIVDEIDKIKSKYPNVRAFYDDDIIKSLTKEEAKALKQIIALNRKRLDFETLGSLKLGIKIGQVL